MILLLLLSLPLFAASSDSFLDVPLIDDWECGPENSKWAFFAKFISIGLVRGCHDAVRADANLCCKAHDHCYDVHLEAHVKQGYCDTRFCNCLQDATDRAKDEGYKCKTELADYCVAVKHFGQSAFYEAHPNNHRQLSHDFQDAKPWGLEMKPLVDACQYSRKIAVHCHNSAVNCLGKAHERDRRDFVWHSHQDCRSTMYDCLQTLIESSMIEQESETCISAARSLADQMRVYTTLDEERHGKAIIDTYPIVASRLLKHCYWANDSLEKCYRYFDDCAQQNPRQHPELYNAARRIKFDCHNDLRMCVNRAVASVRVNGRGVLVHDENCTEAWSLSESLIRGEKLVEEKGVFGAFADTVTETIGDGVEYVVDKTKIGLKKVGDFAADKFDAATDKAVEKFESVKDTFKGLWNSIG